MLNCVSKNGVVLSSLSNTLLNVSQENELTYNGKVFLLYATELIIIIIFSGKILYILFLLYLIEKLRIKHYVIKTFLFNKICSSGTKVDIAVE